MHYRYGVQRIIHWTLKEINVSLKLYERNLLRKTST